MVGVAPSAHAGCPGPAVAVLGYPGLSVTWNTNVIASLNSTGRFCGTIGDIDLNSTSPSLSALAGYDAVLVYTDDAVGFTDPPGWGDVLADYVDAGHRVSLATFGYQTSYTPLGRLSTGNYLPFSVTGSVLSTNNLTLTPDVAGSPLLANVATFDGGTDGGSGGSYRTASTMTTGSLQVAHWSDNSAPLVGAKGNVVGLNFFPPNSNARADLWTASTEGAALLANSLIPSGPLTAPSASFPSTTVGTPVDKTVTITNTGYAFAVPSAITATGTGVTVTGGTCATGTQIAAGGTCTVSLQWTPTAAGSLSGSALTVDYQNGRNPSDSFTLSGSASSASVTQYPLDNCVLSAGGFSKHKKKLMLPSCITNADQPTGVRADSVRTRGDIAFYGFYCRYNGKTLKTYKAYSGGYVACRKGSMWVKARKNLSIKLHWYAPKKGAYPVYSYKKTYNT